MKSRQLNKNKKMKCIMNKAFKKLSRMPHDKFMEEIEKYNFNTCSPELCEGACQGMGDCTLAENFRNIEIPKILQGDEYGIDG